MKCLTSFSCSSCLFAFLRKYFPRRQFDKILGLCRSHSWNANSTLKTFLLQSSAIETDWSKKAFWRKFVLKCCNNLSKETFHHNLYWKRVASSERSGRSTRSINFCLRFVTGTDFVSSMGPPDQFPGLKGEKANGCMKDKANHARQVMTMTVLVTMTIMMTMLTLVLIITMQTTFNI